MSPKPKVNTRKFEVFLPDEAYAKIKKEAEDVGASVSGYVRMLLLKYLAER